MNWRTFLYQIAPSFLRGPWAQKFLWSFGLSLDGVQDWMNQGLNARMPSLADPSALPLLGRDRGIPQGFSEPPEAFALRIRDAFGDARTRGSAWSVVRQLRAYFTGHDVHIATVTAKGTWVLKAVDGAESILKRLGNFNWENDPPTRWARYWVIIWPGALWTDEGTWGDGALWGDGGTWGTTATAAQGSSMREIVRTRKPAGMTCVRIIVALDPDSFDPTDLGEPNGTWKDDGYYVSGVKRPARLASARYFDGTYHESIEA